tara:strand:+ start:2831 stop:3412 length:582 start_codon:yes stop_codon:yes gene_type:complete
VNFTGSYHFREKVQTIWEYLNNPEILKKCINGCEEFIEKEKNSFFLKIKVKIGPINATFTGTLILKDINPPHSYIIEANGSAGQLGGANGKVEIRLDEKENLTYLNYKANTKIHGKIAQLGARLIDGTVKKNTTIFFKNFNSLFIEHNTIKSQMLKEDNYEKEKCANNKRQKKNIYIFLIIFLIIILILMNHE